MGCGCIFAAFGLASATIKRDLRLLSGIVESKYVVLIFLLAMFVYTPHTTYDMQLYNMHIFCMQVSACCISVPFKTVWPFPTSVNMLGCPSRWSSPIRASWFAWGLKLVSGTARGQLKGNIQPKVGCNKTKCIFSFRVLEMQLPYIL